MYIKLIKSLSMKKSIFVMVLSLAMANLVEAQTTSGNMMLGGTLDLSSTKYENSATNSSSIYFSPSFGYFVADNLAVGASITIGNNTSGTGNAKTVFSSFGVGPFARYYKFTSSENFAFFAQAGINF